MEIKIDDYGYLLIQRLGQWKGATCPFRQELRTCGDWCALFGEPETEHFVEDGKNCSETTIDICRKTLSGTIIDER